MMEALASMSIWKLLVLGVFGFLGLILVMVLVLGVAAILGPGIHAVHGAMSVLPKTPRPAMPVSVRVLGAGIVFLSLGLGVVVALALLPSLGGWGMFGAIMLSVGVGLVLFYTIASRAKKESPTRGTDATSAEHQE